jgi:hypothetical protein
MPFAVVPDDNVLFLLSASLAALIIADRTFSLLVTAPTARVCVTEQAGTNHIGLFKPGWSASNCAIGPRDKSGEYAGTLGCLRAPRHGSYRAHNPRGF